MKFSFMQNPLTQIPFFAWIYNSFIISYLLEWLKVRQIKSGIRVNFDQCAPAVIPKSSWDVHLWSSPCLDIPYGPGGVRTHLSYNRKHTYNNFLLT